MLRTFLTVLLLPIFVVACAPASTDTAPQPAAASEAAADAENDHEDDDHGVEESEHGDTDVEEHEHEDEGEHREHGAHEHGAAELTIAWSGNEMAIDLQTPAHNVLGFEYAPATDAEKASLEESIAALEAGDLLQLDPEADCAVTSAMVETAMAEEAHHEPHGGDEHSEESADHEGEDHDEEVHSDIDVAYNLVCQQPDQISTLDASALFAQFPNFEEYSGAMGLRYAAVRCRYDLLRIR